MYEWFFVEFMLVFFFKIRVFSIIKENCWCEYYREYVWLMSMYYFLKYIYYDVYIFEYFCLLKYFKLIFNLMLNIFLLFFLYLIVEWICFYYLVLEKRGEEGVGVLIC